jgi:hypothetical protein
LFNNGNAVPLPAPAGNFDITPSNLGLTQPADYIVNYINGALIVSKANLVCKADNKTRSYGDANPSFTISYTTFVNGDDETDIVAPTATTTATNTSNIGNYNIVLSGGMSNNYNLILQNGILCINKALLNVKADTKFAFKGNSLPTFTSTITGWKNNEQTTITSGPSYSVPSGCHLTTGVYNIGVCCLNFPKKSNYTITYTSGQLYINPKGSGAKRITLSLNCVDTLIGHVSGLPYVAKFKYQNNNSTSVYIPNGSSNVLTSSGVFNGTLPVIFNPGMGTVEVYFSGPTVTWTVKSYENSSLSTVTTSASSNSTRCSAGARFINSSVDEIGIRVFPNPTSDMLNISIPASSTISITEVYDLVGKLVNVPIRLENDHIRLDCSNLNEGIYLVKLHINGTEELIKFMKE